MVYNPYSLRAIFEDIVLELIASMRRNLKRHMAEQEKEGFTWEQWQSAKLRELARYQRENQALFADREAEIQKTIIQTLAEAFRRGETRAEREIIEVMKLLFPADLSGEGLAPPARETAFFGMNKQKLQALQESVAGDIETASQAVLRKMDDVYRQTIFRAEMHMSTGAKTLPQAVDMATKDFLDAGVQSIAYKDGRRVNITSYSEMALRTASVRATLLGEGMKRDEWGVHTVVVSAHASACELCIPWQRKILIDDVFSKGERSRDGNYPLLSEAMEAGLFHPNCRHILSTYFPGITSIPGEIDEETARQNYEAEQEQRYIERQIRRWKRREVGSLDEGNQAQAAAKVREWQGKMRAHLENNPQLRRNYWREKVS